MADDARLARLHAIAAGDGDDAEALDTLRAALVASAPALRVAAALAARDRMAESLSGDLVDGLDDPDPSVRAAMAEAIGVLHFLMGEGADPAAVEGLADALHDEDATVRLAAADALARVGPEDRAARALLAVAPDHLDVEAWLSKVSVCGSAAVPALVEALDHDPHRAHALMGLGRIGRGVMAAADTLTLIARRGGEDAVGACAALTGAGPAAVPVLARLLEDPVAREPALSAIARLGPASSPLAADVVRWADALPVAVAVALVAMQAVDELSRLLDRGTVAQREAIVAALGPPSDELIAVPLQALADPQPSVRAAAATVLGGWGDTARRASADAVLHALHDDPAPQVRLAVARALSRLA